LIAVLLMVVAVIYLISKTNKNLEAQYSLKKTA